jgi:hypothetical protein
MRALAQPHLLPNRHALVQHYGIGHAYFQCVWYAIQDGHGFWYRHCIDFRLALDFPCGVAYWYAVADGHGNSIRVEYAIILNYWLTVVDGDSFFHELLNFYWNSFFNRNTFLDWIAVSYWYAHTLHHPYQHVHRYQGPNLVGQPIQRGASSNTGCNC